MPIFKRKIKEGPQGPPGPMGPEGQRGIDGKDGKTPKRGIDYFNEKDRNEIKRYIDFEIDKRMLAERDGAIEKIKESEEE